MEKIIGINPVTEILKKRKKVDHIEIFKNAQPERVAELIELAKKNNTKIKRSQKRYENSQGVVAYIQNYDYYVELGAFLEKLAAEPKSTVLILDGVQDPRNFGAIIRSAEIFGISGIIIPEKNSVKINETVVKTSTGAIEYVPIVKVHNLVDAMDRLKKLEFWIYGAEGSGTKYYHEEEYPAKTALVLGSEGFGLKSKTKKHCDVLIKIPMKGKINSLNVSVAGGILLSEISKNN